MQAHSELRNLPPVLREMVTRGRPEYERAIRGVHWGDAAIYVVTSARSLPAGLAAACAFEDLLGCVAAVREASSFLAYSLGALRTGSMVILISDEDPKVLEAAKAATQRGAQVLAVARAASPVSAAATRLFPLPEVAGSPAAGITEACLQHVAAGYLALLTAKLLKRPHRLLERLEKEWNAIPDHLDSITNHLVDVVRATAAALRPSFATFWVGDGYYHAAAEGAAGLAQRRGSCPSLGSDLAHFRCDLLPNLSQASGVVFLSGSQSRTRKAVAELAREAKARGANVLCITGSNDHDLIREAHSTLLIPDLAELPASVLSLTVAGWMARELATAPRDARVPRGRAAVSAPQKPSGRVG